MATDKNHDLRDWVQFQLVGAHERQLGPVFISRRQVAEAELSFTGEYLIGNTGIHERVGLHFQIYIGDNIGWDVVSVSQYHLTRL